jgi:hypothetical protein
MNKAIHLTAPAYNTLPLLQIVANALASTGASPSLSPDQLIRLGRWCCKQPSTLPSARLPVLPSPFSVWVSNHRVQSPDLAPSPLSPIRIFPRPKLFPVFDDIGTIHPDWTSRLLPLAPAASRHFVAVDKPGGVPVRAALRPLLKRFNSKGRCTRPRATQCSVHSQGCAGHWQTIACT